MRHCFPDLYKRDPALAHRAAAAGKLSPDQMFVEVPDDFDWAGEVPAPIAPGDTAPQPATEPTLQEMAHNFATATEKWAKAGFAVVTRQQYEQRSAVCAGCEFWDGAARFGLGKCNSPGCGCTRFKRWLATENCPQNKWPVQ